MADLSKNKKGICETATFKSIFTKEGRGLRNFLYFKTGNLSQAEDLVQEAFLKLWEKCAVVLPEKARSFLYTIANNLMIDQQRRKKVILKHRQQLNPMATPPDAGYLLEMQEFKIRLESVIDRMPEKSRIVFLLNRIEKKTYTEIAAQLGIGVKAVEKRMHRALQDFRKLEIEIGRKKKK